MAQEPDRPPTYDELLAENAKLKAYALRLEEAVRSLHATAKMQEAEIGRLTLKAKKKPQRPLDPTSSSPYDRPYDGR